MRSEVGASRTAFAEAVLSCKSSNCIPARSGETVIVVTDPSATGTDVKVLLQVYMPTDRPDEYDGRLTLAIVAVKNSGSGWTGMSYAEPLRVVRVRMGKTP